MRRALGRPTLQALPARIPDADRIVGVTAASARNSTARRRGGLSPRDFLGRLLLHELGSAEAAVAIGCPSDAGSPPRLAIT